MMPLKGVEQNTALNHDVECCGKSLYNYVHLVFIIDFSNHCSTPVIMHQLDISDHMVVGMFQSESRTTQIRPHPSPGGDHLGPETTT